MKIQEACNVEQKLQDVNPGDPFIFEGELHIKGDEQDNKSSVILRLHDGEVSRLNNQTLVRPAPNYYITND